MLFLAHCLGAQSLSKPTILPEAAARDQLATQPDPVYPPIAKAAHVQGDVIVSVIVDEKGRIVSAKVVSGPAMLQQAALDAVKKFQFNPFSVGNKPIRITTTLTIPFHIDKPGEGPSAEQQKAAQAWFPLSDKCRKALQAQQVQESVDYCRHALEMSIKAGDLTSSDQLGNMLSHQYYGHALWLTGVRSNEALEQENLAIEESKKCLKDTDQEYAMPYFWRALIEGSTGQGSAALADFKVAEETHRRAIEHLPEMKNNYSKTLANILRYHAVLLEMMGKPDEAAKLRAEADSL
jgi:TonB family protein